MQDEEHIWARGVQIEGRSEAVWFRRQKAQIGNVLRIMGAKFLTRKYGKGENGNKPWGSRYIGTASAFRIRRYKSTCRCRCVCVWL